MLPPFVSPVPVSAGVLTAASASNAWQVGTLLSAVALGATSAGRVRLQIGARIVEASTDLQLNRGQSLRLRVSETGRRLVLRTENPDSTQARVLEGIRSALPRQAPQAPLLATAQRAAQAASPLPPAVNRALAAFVKHIPRAVSLTQATTLREAIQQSGTFLESAIASGRAANVARDWKNALLQLRERLVVSQPGQNRPGGAAAAPPAATARSQAPAPPPPLRQQPPVAQPVIAEARLAADPWRVVEQLTGQTDAALARVKLNQLASTPAEQAGQRLAWLIELPVRHGNGDVEVLPLTIEREPGGSGPESQPVWAVNLAFDLGDGGSLRARIALRGDQVYTSFWTAQDSTRASVEKNLDSLRAAMERNRIRVGCLTCSVAEAEPPASHGHGEALVETRA